MKECFLKRGGGFLLGVCAIAVMIFIPVLLLRGAVWVFQNIEDWLLAAASVMFDICVFLFCPLSMFKRTRPLAGLGFLVSSYVFGTAWFGLSCLVVFTVWGYTGLIVSLLLGGIGVVPIAFLAALFHPTSVTFWPLPVGLVLTYGTRLLGGHVLNWKLEGQVRITEYRSAAGWFWKRWWKRMGLADVERMPEWGAEDWTREFQYARRRFELATDEDQKRDRSLDILALLDVAGRYGFVLKREGASFDTLHFVKRSQEEGKDGASFGPDISDEDIPF